MTASPRSRRKPTAASRGERSQPPPPPATPRDWIAPLAAVALVWAALFAPLLVGGQRVVFGDAATFRPFAGYSRARWHEAHVRTHWNPYVFMGLESVASLADSRPQYLPGALIGLAERLHEPPIAPQLWLLLLHLAGALAVLALCRRLWLVPPWAAACAGIVWLGALPILGPFGHGFDAMFVSTALLPIAVLATHVALVPGPPRAALAAAALLAIALGVSALHGHPQVLVYTGMLLIAFAAQQALVHRAWDRLVLWSGAVLLGVAIGAATWWPAMQWAAGSSRGGLGAPQIPIETLARYSLAPRDLASLVWPHAVGFGHASYWGGLHVSDFPPYLGAVAAALLGCGVGAAGGRAARFWWITLGLAVLLALGTNLGPSDVALHRVLPFWNRFRAPSYTLLVATLAFALLAGRGAAVAVETAPKRRTIALALLGLAALAGIALATGALAGAYTSVALASRPGLAPAAAAGAATRAGWDLFLRAMLAIAALTAVRDPRSYRHAGPVLAVLVALDLGAAVMPEFHTYVGAASRVASPSPPPLARVAAADPHARVYVGAAAPVLDANVAMGQYAEAYTNAWSDWHVRNLTGNLGAFPAGWTLVMELGMTRSLAALAAWGVSWFDVDRAAPPIPGATPTAEDDRSRVYPLAGALGRLYAVPRVFVLVDEPAVARAMLSPPFVPHEIALTTEPKIAGGYPGGGTTTFEWIDDGPEHVAFTVNAYASTFVVLADSYSPGWSVRIDGHPARAARVNLLARGVAVPAGSHRVEWTYATPGRAVGVAVTRVGLAIWALLTLALSAGLRPRRPTAATPAT